MDASQPHNIPDTEIMILPINGLERHVPGHSPFSLYPTLIQPYATGRIGLASTDPLANPRITHPMLIDERDLAAARVAARFTMRLAEGFQNSGYPYPAPFAFAPGNNPELLREWENSGEVVGNAANLVPDIAASTLPNSSAGVQENAEAIATSDTKENGNKTWKNVTDREIDDYVRRVSHTSLHFSCTCPMSNNDEKSGVVDQKLRVYGFKNLRIADASVFPRVPSGHTMAPVMMVAERCAYFIKKEWNERRAE
ncbi:Glucose dehydrogenase [FAD, quinone] [Cytospora mali]|uniref:Glucose dehydrogenase [FAD, quinone] n=1 Tax=Cytospora mali TaxID=578113 RepID=A0A194WAX0_CYTMA|nr:Glucose dehydrogenase [FAD, quinone] [Valsa mali]